MDRAVRSGRGSVLTAERLSENAGDSSRRLGPRRAARWPFERNGNHRGNRFPCVAAQRRSSFACAERSLQKQPAGARRLRRKRTLLAIMSLSYTPPSLRRDADLRISLRHGVHRRARRRTAARSSVYLDETSSLRSLGDTYLSVSPSRK